jgi:hypothetical protein
MAIIKKPINEMSDASVAALYNLFENKGLSSLVEYTPAGSYEGVIDFEKNYYFSHTQTANLLFTAINREKPFTIFQLTLNVNADYNIEFSPDFLIYRNDIDDTDSVYHFWFCSLPGGSVGTSIVKVGTYEPSAPVVLGVPYAANLVNRYNYSNVVVDEISQKISEITSTQNAAFSLASTTDATRPVLSLANKRIEFNNIAVTENKAATLFIDSTVWSVVFLTQFDGNFNGSATVTLMSNLSSKMLSPYTNTVTGFINNVTMSINASEPLARGVIGVHVHALVQTESALEYYIDGVLIKTQATSGAGLTLTNILSIYNATRAQAGRIKYFYDAMFYDIALDTNKLSEVTTYLGSVYPNVKPADGPVISNFALTNISQGQNLGLGDTINFSYTVDSGSVAEIYIYFMTGATTHRVVVRGNTVNSVLVPSGLVVLTGVWCKVLAVDSNGRCSNFSGTNAITFNRV